MEVKEAVSKAKNYAMALFSEDGAIDFALEEVEHDRARSFWLITLSFRRRRAPSDGEMGKLGIALEQLGPRYSKIVKVDNSTGEILSVTNRERGLAA